MTLKTLLFAATATLIALPAQAQDYSLEPTYGTVALETGFPDDPAVVELHSGGEVDASRLGGACVGFIATAPDYRVHYTAGVLPLTFVAVSSVDTTLVINAPDGSWYCNDDSGGEFNPVLNFPTPISGQYDVWVGTYEGNILHEATLYITELAGE